MQNMYHVSPLLIMVLISSVVSVLPSQGSRYFCNLSWRSLITTVPLHTSQYYLRLLLWCVKRNYMWSMGISMGTIAFTMSSALIQFLSVWTSVLCNYLCQLIQETLKHFHRTVSPSVDILIQFVYPQVKKLLFITK